MANIRELGRYEERLKKAKVISDGEMLEILNNLQTGHYEREGYESSQVHNALLHKKGKANNELVKAKSWIRDFAAFQRGGSNRLLSDLIRVLG